MNETQRDALRFILEKLINRSMKCKKWCDSVRMPATNEYSGRSCNCGIQAEKQEMETMLERVVVSPE